MVEGLDGVVKARRERAGRDGILAWSGGRVSTQRRASLFSGLRATVGQATRPEPVPGSVKERFKRGASFLE